MAAVAAMAAVAKSQFPGTFNTLDVSFRPPPGEQRLRESSSGVVVVVEPLPPPERPAEEPRECAPPGPDPEEEETDAKPAGYHDHGDDDTPEPCYDVGAVKLRHLKDIVEKVVKEHKTFCVEGAYNHIRNAMKKRGWLEKSEQVWPSKRLKENTSGLQSPKDKNPALISRMLRNIQVDFLWTSRAYSSHWYDFRRRQIVSRFPRTGFNTKVGLCSSLQQQHWYYEEGVSNTLFPRCYNIYNTEELEAFKDDFHMTASISLLKWLVDNYENKKDKAVSSTDGKIPVAAVEFAISRCDEYVSVQTHEDLDHEVCGQTWDHQWDQFLTWYYMAVHKNERLAQAPEPSMLLLYNLAVHTLEKVQKHWSQMHLDGMLNVWIVKPGANSRGRGIQLMNRMEKVLAKVNPAFVKETRYVVQKYIERPLLIYNTKFDIRQWFLVTCVQPMTIWMYRESYLRFCSQCFDLLNFHESVHLCNNAVQRKYRNGVRDPKLPDENMWDCYTFQAYLRTLGKAEMWSQRIYPGMCQGIVGALLASQENIDGKSNCFELFGADFILDEAFTPWLIEINSCPSMCESTSVTARMCPQCLEDVIKVHQFPAWPVFRRLFNGKVTQRKSGGRQTVEQEGRHWHVRAHIQTAPPSRSSVPWRLSVHSRSEGEQDRHGENR
ncbi:tubulin glycylase 3A-like [Bacillus rossius redtenbacheri]|uniref:tubulin glycylase 3A-like n=1 Tax=Bacillus rossius redtenbacheri TaxID=93214 RepID=UPI002FDE0676